MKSLEELKAIRDRAKRQMEVREENSNNIRISVGMATCGIAAGARPVMNKLLEQIEKHKLSNVTVTQTGCIGICQYEPIVEVFFPGKEKVTYVNMNEEKAARVIKEHIINNHIIKEYTIGAN